MKLRDNKVTKDLKRRCEEKISKIKNLPLEERRNHYEELHLLLQELYSNRDKEICKYLNSAFDDVCPIPIIDDVVIEIDRGAQEYIQEIFKILTNKIDD